MGRAEAVPGLLFLSLSSSHLDLDTEVPIKPRFLLQSGHAPDAVCACPLVARSESVLPLVPELILGALRV